MSRSLIFIQNTISGYHCHRRVEEAIAHGWQVVVYGFQRPNEPIANDWSYTVTSLGIVEDGNYLQRIKTYLRGIKQVLHAHPEKENIFYIFGLDITAFFVLFRKRYHQYIYEESDMVHTYMSPVAEHLLECVDKYVIRHALKYVSTSEGFVQYHFGGKNPENLILKPNQLSAQVLSIGTPDVNIPDTGHIRIGFMGTPRFDSIHTFIRCFLQNFPQHEFHFFGKPDNQISEYIQQYSNFHDHGTFRNPDDLMNVYEKVDMVLCTYDPRSANVRYAEPNKLYEAIYFCKPIIVTRGTFLADKVSQLSVGYTIDPFSDKEIVEWLSNLSSESLSRCINHCQQLGTDFCIDDGNQLFNSIK